jgi:hypothetical protein
MKTKPKTVSIHARLVESDVAEVDEAASDQPIPVSRSMMIALIIRDWIKQGQTKGTNGNISKVDQ